MSSVISNYLGNAALQRYFLDDLTWLALHESDPGVTGSLASELAGGDYEREPSTWTSPAAKTIALAARIRYDNLPACELFWFGVWDAEINGHLLTSVEIPGGLEVVDSARLVIPAGDIAITF